MNRKRFVKPPLVALFLLCPAFSQGTPPWTWSATAPMLEARESSCALRLPDGRVLVTGGVGLGGDLASTEFYLPQGSFIAGPPMNSTRSGHTCTLLNDGRVLVAAGDTDGTGSAELFDPAIGEWQFVAGTGEARRGHTATLLPDGEVLLAGGDGANGPLDSIEIFDPQSNSLISSDPALLEARSQHAAVLLADGRVMFIGGKNATTPLASTEIFDPRYFSIAAGPALSTARAGHSAVRLDDGRILVAGGFDGSKETDSAETLDASGAAWTTLDAHLNTARRNHLAILIPGNGGVLIAGGLKDGEPLGATELFLPVENTFLSLGPLTLARSAMAVATVDAGLILAAGGRNADGPQSACGILQVPSIRFSRAVYNIPETAAATFSSFPVSGKVNLSLSVAPGSSTIPANDRLLTSSVTVSANTTQTVPIVLTQLTDAGKTARLTASAGTNVTIVATAPIRNATALALGLPQAVYEGSNASLLAVLSRGPGVGTMTGTLAMATSSILDGASNTFIPDGTSNTILIGETPNTTTAVVNTSGSAASVQKSLTSLAPGTVQVSANYSGDVANDPASTRGSFLVVSRTPRLDLSTSVRSAQAGVPFTVTASVQTNGTVPNPQPFTGSLAILQSGFPVLGATTLSTASGMFSSAAITPLTLNPISLNATYSGDSFFRSVATAFITVNVDKATPTLTMTSPSTYTCGQPSIFNVTLSYPVALGLTNHNVSIQALASDGSVRNISSSIATPPGGPLVVIPPGPKDTTAKATAALTTVLPLDFAGVVGTFSGDTLLTPATSSTVNPTLQKLTPTVNLNLKVATPVTNPAALIATVSAPCSVPPTGTVEFLDGTSSLAVVQLGAGSTLPFLEQALATPSSSIATLSVSRPPGIHNLSVRYSGDRHYQAATSATVPVTFQ